MLEDISGLLEFFAEFLFELASDTVSEVISAVRDALSGGQSHRNEGAPVERLKLPPKDSGG